MSRVLASDWAVVALLLDIYFYNNINVQSNYIRASFSYCIALVSHCGSKRMNNFMHN